MGQRGFKQLTARDRVLIGKLRTQKLSVSEIARRIGKNKSTVSRELRRNVSVETAQYRYFGFRIARFWTEQELAAYLKTRPIEERRTHRVWRQAKAQEFARCRRFQANKRRRRKSPDTDTWIVEQLRLGWSPQQIAGRSKLERSESVSHEYVYTLIIRDKKRGGRLYRLLKRFRKRKQRLGQRDYGSKSLNPNRLSIDKRPAVVAMRSRLGDLEADLLGGFKQSGYVLTVIDRKSRKAVLRKLKSKRKRAVRSQLEQAMAQLGPCHTLTCDNGKEFYDHAQLTKSTGVKVYFTHPYSSSERGSIENFNGLLRYYLPKGTSFTTLTQARLRAIQLLLNHRPRKCLGYLTPHEVHRKTNRLRRA
jgi:IS30 family transposase